MASGGKCILQTGFGGPEVYAVDRKPVPDPADDEIRVRIGAAGVAFAEVKMRHGVYPNAPKVPFTPGFDFSGVVDAVGRDVTAFQVGDPCIGLSLVGAYAEYLTMKPDHVAPAPEGLDPVAGAAIPLNYLTAYQMLERLAEVSPGDTILIHGGAGGVGTALLDLTKDAGLKVYATASAGKHDVIRSYGAIPIDYRTESFVDVLRAQGGAAAVFDHIGGDHFAESARAAMDGGRVIAFGFLSAVRDKDLQVRDRTQKAIAQLNAEGRVKPRFYGILSPGVSQEEYIAQDLAALAARVASGELKPNVGKVLPLDQVALAHELLEGARVTGKIVLSVTPHLAGNV